MKAYLLVMETLADWEIGYLTAELNSKRMFADRDADFALVKVGLTEAEVTTMGGIRIKPDLVLADVVMGPRDLLLMPGSDFWLTPEVAPALAFARQQLEQGHRVAAICGATIGLASVGALDKRPHTSNDGDFLKTSCPGYTGEAYYQQQFAVSDGNLVTASGVAALEFSYEVMKMLELFRPATLDAWLNLYKTGEGRYYEALVASLAPGA